MCVPPSLTVCQRSGQTQDSRSPSEPRLCPLDQSASGASLPRVRAAGWMVITVHAALVPARGRGTTPPECESFQPAWRGGLRAAGLQRGVWASGRGPQRSFPALRHPLPTAPQGAVHPWRRAWPRGSGEGADTGWEPPVCGDPPLRPPQPLDLSAQGTISQMRGLGCTGAR